MGEELRIGMIGLDTSHCEAFAEILHDRSHPFHVPGARIAAAYPGGSPDFPLSAGRVGTIAANMQARYGVRLSDSIAEVARQTDAILITSVDGRVHRQQVEQVASFGKPVFIDKPLAASVEDAKKIFELAHTYNLPVMSCSSLRFARGVVDAIHQGEQHGYGPVTGAYCFGPMPLEPVMPGLYWYGIHSVEMLFAILGMECRYVSASTNEQYELITAVWSDGRIGTLRGDRTWNKAFGALIHYRETACFVDISAHPKPYYASLLEQIVSFFQTGKSPVEAAETLAILRFIEAANESRDSGKTVCL